MNANRTERVLATMILSMVGLGLASILAIIIATAAKATLSGGLWPVVLVLPSIALPLAFVLLIALLILYAVRRSRASRDAER